MRQGRGGRLVDKEDNTNEKWSFLQISILFVTELLLYGYPPLPTFLPCPPCLSFLVCKKPTPVSPYPPFAIPPLKAILDKELLKPL
jgi:hypothetical protein